MSTRTTAAPTSTRPARPPFARIVCGVAGTASDREAVHQAAMLAGRGATIEVVAVAGRPGTQATSRATLERGAARKALRRASDLARDRGVKAHVRCVEGAPARARLLDEAVGHDLLVVGARGFGRPAGILLGSTATMALHRAPCPVLIARDGHADPAFPATVLLADDGSQSARAAARAAVDVASATGARLVVAAPAVMTARERHLLGEHLAAAVAAGLPEPVVLDVQGPAPHAIAALARDVDASLIVLGSRCRRGIRAIGSVSERTAHLRSLLRPRHAPLRGSHAPHHRRRRERVGGLRRRPRPRLAPARPRRRPARPGHRVPPPLRARAPRVRLLLRRHLARAGRPAARPRGRAARAGVRHDRRLLADASVPLALGDLAERIEADLIVLGAGRHGDGGRVATWLRARGGVPVLVASDAAAPEPAPA